MGLYEFDDPREAFEAAEERIREAQASGATDLNLSRLGLTEVPESLGRLGQLKILQLHVNRLAEVPESLSQLKRVKMVALAANRLKAVPEWFGQLAELQYLYLFANQLTVLPERLGGLKQLRMLALFDNQLTALPESLRQLPVLEELYLHGNDALGLPGEILGVEWRDSIGQKEKVTNARDILDYYFRTRGGKRPLNEAKLILLGRGEVGKTCLVNRLVHNKFGSTSMTRGINITAWPVKVRKDTVRVHVWDFGGQEIQHATHQFFLTERSLYLVVLNGRAGRRTRMRNTG